MSEIIPVTRTEQLLAQAAGMSVSAPTPVTRIERLLQQIANKTGYTEPAKMIGSVYLDETLEGVGTYFESAVLPSKFQALREGETYVVKTDSGTFERVCSTFTDEDGTLNYIGNPKVYGGEDNGDSFLVSTAPVPDEPEFMGLGAIDYNFGSHIIVSTPETVHTIDPKYISGVCLPVLNLSAETLGALGEGINTGKLVEFNESETAEVRHSISLAVPLVVRYENAFWSIASLTGGGLECDLAGGHLRITNFEDERVAGALTVIDT